MWRAHIFILYCVEPVFLTFFYVLYISWSQGIYPLNLLAYEDGPGDKAEHILEIRRVFLAMLYKVKNEWQFRRHRSDFPKCRA